MMDKRKIVGKVIHDAVFGYYEAECHGCIADAIKENHVQNALLQQLKFELGRFDNDKVPDWQKVDDILDAMESLALGDKGVYDHPSYGDLKDGSECLRCGHISKEITCPGCGRVRPPEEMIVIHGPDWNLKR
jgi:hypothetical protein